MAVSVMPPRWWADIQHDVMVVAHQAVRLHRGVEALAGLAQQRQEPGAVVVVQEDGLAPAAAAGDGVQRVRGLGAQRAGDGGGAVVAVF